MHMLRNILYTVKCSTLLRQTPNALHSLTQPNDGSTAAASNTDDTPVNSQEQQTAGQPLLIPKSILDATNFKGGLKPRQPGQVSPSTLKRYRHMERKVELVYRCKLCNTRNSKMVTEAAYTSGVVILQCDGCSVNHLIRDNLGWFANTNGKSFDEVLAAQGERIKVIKVNERGDLI